MYVRTTWESLPARLRFLWQDSTFAPQAVPQTNDFTASESNLGYEFQAVYALSKAISHPDENASIAIELLDDLQIQTDEITELHQLKHYAPASQISDRSPQLWKSLRVWCELYANGALAVNDFIFVLATTSQPQENSIVGLLSKNDDVDAKEAAKQLLAIAEEGGNAALAKAYNAVKKVGETGLRAILSRTRIICSSDRIDNLLSNTKHVLGLTLRPRNQDALFERVWGWWALQVLRMLLKQRAPVRVKEVALKIQDIASQLSDDNLPIDFRDYEEAPDLTMAPSTRYKDQLKRVNISERRIRQAEKDYIRAFRQRTKWIDDELLFDNEDHNYDRRLIEAWEIRSHQLCDRCGASEVDISESDCLQIGQDLVAWVELAHIPIRKNVTEEFITRGSFHMLADEAPPRVWWHPHYGRNGV